MQRVHIGAVFNADLVPGFATVGIITSNGIFRKQVVDGGKTIGFTVDEHISSVGEVIPLTDVYIENQDDALFCYFFSKTDWELGSTSALSSKLSKRLPNITDPISRFDIASFTGDLRTQSEAWLTAAHAHYTGDDLQRISAITSLPPSEKPKATQRLVPFSREDKVIRAFSKIKQIAYRILDKNNNLYHLDPLIFHSRPSTGEAPAVERRRAEVISDEYLSPRAILKTIEDHGDSVVYSDNVIERLEEQAVSYTLSCEALLTRQRLPQAYNFLAESLHSDRQGFALRAHRNGFSGSESFVLFELLTSSHRFRETVDTVCAHRHFLQYTKGRPELIELAGDFKSYRDLIYIGNRTRFHEVLWVKPHSFSLGNKVVCIIRNSALTSKENPAAEEGWAFICAALAVSHAAQSSNERIEDKVVDTAFSFFENDFLSRHHTANNRSSLFKPEVDLPIYFSEVVRGYKIRETSSPSAEFSVKDLGDKIYERCKALKSKAGFLGMLRVLLTGKT